MGTRLGLVHLTGLGECPDKGGDESTAAGLAEVLAGHGHKEAAVGKLLLMQHNSAHPVRGGGGGCSEGGGGGAVREGEGGQQHCYTWKRLVPIQSQWNSAGWTR